MRTWIGASLLFFSYTAFLGLLLPRLDRRRRTLALTGSIIGTVIALATRSTPHSILHDWIVPPSLLLIGYWTSGLLYQAPMPRAERALCRIDRIFRIREIAAATPRVVAEVLELAYLAVYPIVPVALIIHIATSAAPDPSRFWTMILVTDYICFGVLPWVQTRPPRALETEPPWPSRFRRLNLRLLGKTSIQVNTFPSGHAAEAAAAFLLVLDAPVLLVGGMLVTALAISAGATFGRYHFATDIVAGWAVALIVWLSV